MKTSNVHVIIIPSRQEGIFYMNVKDLMGIGTQGEIL